MTPVIPVRSASMRALTACATAVLILMLVLTPGAALGKALPPGVHVDPGSPAGKEYQIPVASARSLGQGKTGSSSSANPPLFGVGVSSSTTSTTTSSTSSSPGAGATSAARARRRASARRTARKHRKRSAHIAPHSGGHITRTLSAQPGGEGWLPLVVGGVLVLVVGGGGGLGLRRRYLQA